MPDTQGHRPADRHGVGSVEEQVQHDLLQRVGIRRHENGSRLDVELDLDMPMLERLAHERPHFREQAAGVDDLRTERTIVGRLEKTLHQAQAVDFGTT